GQRGDEHGVAQRLAGGGIGGPAGLGQRRHSDPGPRPDAGAPCRHAARRARWHGDRGCDRLRARGGGQGQKLPPVRRYRQGFLHPRHLCHRRYDRESAATAAAPPARLVQGHRLHAADEGFRGGVRGKDDRGQAQHRRENIRCANGVLFQRRRLESGGDRGDQAFAQGARHLARRPGGEDDLQRSIRSGTILTMLQGSTAEQGGTLAQERRRRLLGAMADAGIEHMVLYGNAWQGDYLRYAADFAILEGHGIAVVSSDGATELFLDSATEAERAEAETTETAIHFVPEVARALAARLDPVANRRLAAAPRRFLPNWLVDKGRRFVLEDATALLDRLLMHKLPAEIAALRRAAQMADDSYTVFRDAVKPGRRQYEVAADIEGYLRRRGCPDNFMIIGSGGTDVLGMTPPSERRIAPGDLVTTELTPAVDGYFVQICRTLVVGKANDAQRRAFDVFREALAAGIAAVRPGATAADV